MKQIAVSKRHFSKKQKLFHFANTVGKMKNVYKRQHESHERMYTLSTIIPHRFARADPSPINRHCRLSTFWATDHRFASSSVSCRCWSWYSSTPNKPAETLHWSSQVLSIGEDSTPRLLLFDIHENQLVIQVLQELAILTTAGDLRCGT